MSKRTRNGKKISRFTVNDQKLTRSTKNNQKYTDLQGTIENSHFYKGQLKYISLSWNSPKCRKKYLAVQNDQILFLLSKLLIIV